MVVSGQRQNIKGEKDSAFTERERKVDARPSTFVHISDCLGKLFVFNCG